MDTQPSQDNHYQRLLLIFALSAASLFSWVPISMAADVLLMADGVRGQGTLQRRGDECLIVTPRHVVDNDALEIIATFPDRQEINASVLEIYAEDVALLRLAEQPTNGCTERAFINERLPAILKSATEGVLKRRDETGSASLLQVDVVGYDEHRLIRVEPRSSSKSIKQGFSGSVLYIDSQAVGMLIKNERAESETGLVLRAEMLNATIDPFFNAAQGDRSFHIDLDSISEFLLPEFQSLARAEQLALGDNPADTTFDLKVTSELRKLDSDTDKIIEYKIRLVVFNPLDRAIIDQTMTASGNSFVSLQSAQKSAQAQLTERIRQSAFLKQLP